MSIKSRVVCKSAVIADSCNLDVSSSARLLSSFPIDLVSNSGQGKMSFEVSARSNLEVVIVSVRILALNDFSVDGNDKSVPMSEVGGVEAIRTEVRFI